MPSIPPEVAAAVLEAEMMVLDGLSQRLLAGAGALLLVTLAALGWLVRFDAVPRSRA